MITLDNVPSGHRVKVTKILALGKAVLNRLYQLGILPGSVIEVVANYGCGPVVVKIHGSETAIGRSIARRIIVEETD